MATLGGDRQKEKDLAQEGCKKQFEKCLKQVASRLADCLAESGGDAAKKTRCREEYKNNMKFCKTVYETNLKVIEKKVSKRGPI